MSETDASQVAQQTGPSRSAPCEQRRRLEGTVGSSAAWIGVLALAEAVAVTDATVLILGETGTGKELIARALHSASERAAGPFVKVNCSALPAESMASELMGHERGASRGTESERTGRFDTAHNGTLFLDEIGELPIELQPKLLRVLQEREFERVGGTRTVRTNVRVVAATQRDLRAMVKERAFREDLYHRLHVFPLLLPPLRARADDIPQLAQHFIARTAQRLGKRAVGLSGRSIAELMNYHWPGNIRELESVIERAVILSTSEVIEIAGLLKNAGSLPAHPIDDQALVRSHHP